MTLPNSPDDAASENSQPAHDSRRGLAPVTLLWPPGRERAAAETTGTLDGDAVRDLGLGDVVAALSLAEGDRRNVEAALLRLCRDPEVIHYRQDIVADLVARPELAERLAGLMPALRGLVQSHFPGARPKSTLEEVVWRLGELEHYVACVESLQKIMDEAGTDVRAEGLQRLRDLVEQVAGSETFQNLLRELPDLLRQARTTSSVTIGVNLNHYLQPVAATLLSVNDKKFRRSSVLGKLFGADAGEGEGIAPLHGLPDEVTGGAGPVPIAGSSPTGFTPMMVPLFRDLAHVLEKAAQPIAWALKRYSEVNSGLLDGLARELSFYLAAVRLIDRLRGAGLPCVRPDIVGEDERTCEVKDSYNLDLALRLAAEHPGGDLSSLIVTNDISFGPPARVLILTGPNQGGKTTYIQSIGLVQVLAQAGLYVPGSSASISPVDRICTHFPAEEKLAQGTGRFGDEAQRLHEMFARITSHSLVLLNESLSSTSAGEGLYLGQDIVRVLRLLGVRAIFATHLHDLAAGIEQLNSEAPGDGRVVSLVASPVSGRTREDRLSYKVVAGPPLGRSYAAEIAERYGVSYDQLKTLLSTRGLLPE